MGNIWVTFRVKNGKITSCKFKQKLAKCLIIAENEKKWLES